MVLTATAFTSLLHSLGLMQGISKPIRGPLAAAPAPAQNKVAVSSGPSPNSNLGTNYQVHAPGNLSNIGTSAIKASTACDAPDYDARDWGEQRFAPFDQAKANVYRYRQQQSVNLGSWFTHEQWMTSSLFTCASGSQISELDIATGWGSPDGARAVLERHWDTFVDVSDFQYLSGIGINTVRLPIGYWSLGPAFCQGTPFESVADVYRNSWSRVVHAINMASDAGIGVLVDLHGAPGSQNGQPHSGISDGQTNLFGNDYYIGKTMDVLTFLTQQLTNVTNVVGIQILNEPQNADSLPAFYTQAISTMRQVSSAAAALPLYIHDGFNLEQYSQFVADRSDFVVQDHHSYFVFTPQDNAESASGHTKDIQSSISGSLAAASDRQRRNLVVDEFSCALTEQSLSSEADPNQARRAFCEGQLQIYQNETAGWSFWAYNKEDCSNDPGWCFKAAVGNSLPSSFFSYGKGPLADPSRLPALADMAADMDSPTHEEMTNTPSSAPAGPSGYSASTPYPEVGIYPSSLDPSQRAISKGYSDGFLTAKIFALYGMSKLGFTGQYMSDSIASLGPGVIAPGKEHDYEQWFMEGLADGEALISSSVNSTYAS
ncbi:glycoside hydrolase [Trametes versicolor FP-101664 SS1]|uniref:glycoside hydrolase n=1 Tax=Trametes versicolor (strain FP-101664) TaxID=717944 RepID=UPI0004624069|nr:glycoside hydrolase [Trametes versicolor FP-101664 SS1]EIW60057.1 glycoside hydrolase [Trametes versicolor FP-101664 SS1]